MGFGMVTIDRKDIVTGRAQFCPECGQPAGDTNFCPGCGHNMGFTADRALADPSVQAPGRAGSSRARVSLIVASAALGVVAVAVAAVILLSGGGGSGTNSSYKQELGKAFGPLVSANQTLSGALTSLDGSKAAVRTAKTDASQALAALGAAHGAVAVLSAPSSETSLSSQVEQALTAENGYLQAVSSTLASPTGPSAGQLQTLATGAQSALDPLGTVVAAAGASVSGTQNLVSWAQGASGQAQAQRTRAQQHATQQAAVRAAQRAASAAAQSSSGSGAAASVGAGGASATGAISCGNGLFAGAHTSCAFAQNVQTAWENTPGESNIVTAYSPVTGQTYTESCGPSGSGTMCTGVGADNSVWWG
jgi:hypothetical protein